MNNLLCEIAIPEVALVNSDIVADKATARVKLDKAFNLAFTCLIENSAGGNVTLTMEQHDAAAAGNSVALNFYNRVYYKKSSDTEYQVEEATGQATVDLTNYFSGETGIVIVEVLASDLADGNSYANLKLAAAGAAKEVSITSLLRHTKNNPAC